MTAERLAQAFRTNEVIVKKGKRNRGGAVTSNTPLAIVIIILICMIHTLQIRKIEVKREDKSGRDSVD